MKPRLLDLFCGAGGASCGYQRAGFHVTGVDHVPQPRYCGDEFIQADALEYVRCHGHEYDAIHASPPCQAFTAAQPIQGKAHADLLTPARELLRQTGSAWVIENVPGAPMRPDVVLCGSMFGLGVKRHRWFEFFASLCILTNACRHDWVDGPVGVYGHTGTGSTRYGRRKNGNHGYTVSDWREAMEITWMTRDELAQAIPAAYTEFVGLWLLQALTTAREGSAS